MSNIKVLIFDIDGTIMPQGGPIDPRVGEVFRRIQGLGLKVGPATGKGADYGRGLACGIGTIWDFVIAETGAQVLETISKTPPSFRQHSVVSSGNKDLCVFAQKIGLDQIGRTFDFCGHVEMYRPELKECIITMFPPGKDVEVTAEWQTHFDGMIELCGLNLRTQRFKDGCIDILPMEVNKSLGVHTVCRMLGCGADEVVTAVDGVNDFELLVPGCKVIAVNNAVESIKKAARGHGGFVSTHDCGTGFADGLLQYARQGAFGAISPEIVQCIKPLFPELKP